MFLNKYNKYKHKYLNLLNQNGGLLSDINNGDHIFIFNKTEDNISVLNDKNKEISKFQIENKSLGKLINKLDLPLCKVKLQSFKEPVYINYKYIYKHFSIENYIYLYSGTKLYDYNHNLVLELKNNVQVKITNDQFDENYIEIKINGNKLLVYKNKIPITFNN